jgi:hypothetical protein
VAPSVRRANDETKLTIAFLSNSAPSQQVSALCGLWRGSEMTERLQELR